MCQYCQQDGTQQQPAPPDAPCACEVCGQPATCLVVQRSVLCHLCDGHRESLEREWQEADRAYFSSAGLSLTSEYLPIPAGESCGYRLPGRTPQLPGPVCGEPASHVQVDSDRHAYCEAHRPE
jgi:hypothetical protein